MTDKPLNEPSIKTLEKRGPRRPSAWFLSGLVLWAAVFGAAYFVIRLKTQSEHHSVPVPDVVIVESVPSTSHEGGKESSGPSAPAPVWDPAGVKDFSFTERSGRTVTKADLLGHPWIIAFVFTRCAGPCPRVSSQMGELQRMLKGTDIRLVTLTVDPDFDTTEVLDRYARAYGADPKQWLYLTGDKKKTYRLIIDSFKLPVQEDPGPDGKSTGQVSHSTNLLLVNEKGVVVQKYNALDQVEMTRLRHDLKPYLEKARPPAPSGKEAGAPQKRSVR